MALSAQLAILTLRPLAEGAGRAVGFEAVGGVIGAVGQLEIAAGDFDAATGCRPEPFQQRRRGGSGRNWIRRNHCRMRIHVCSPDESGIGQIVNKCTYVRRGVKKETGEGVRQDSKALCQ